MSEEEARDWIDRHFGCEKRRTIEQFVQLLIAETEKQNLVAPSTLDTIWNRHIADSAQLIHLAERQGGVWLDIGTGGGFPGIVVAVLADFEVILTEPRRRRAMFLEACVEHLGLGSNCRVIADKVENMQTTVDIISARAVARIEKLLRDAVHCATIDTRWLLPRGAIKPDEVATIQQRWRGMFHVEQSITADRSFIVRATEVKRK